MILSYKDKIFTLGVATCFDFFGVCAVVKKPNDNIFILRKKQTDSYQFTISGFRTEVDGNCALLGCYAARIDNFIQTFRDNLSVP